ncbi:MAG TPA: diguanylate cyclase [Bryobacteraceae bacterium]|nr:diguanylate cyclase [Bryobacteraceae bacterium]
MLSLKSFLNASESELALRKVVSLLIEKIGASAAKGDGDEHADFCAEMNDLRDRLAAEVSSENLLIMAGSAVQTMENYNLRISTLIRRQAAELQSVIAMVTETALKIGGESTRSAQRLQEIGNHFEKAGSFDDLKTLKAHLGECLNSFRQEVERQKHESDSAIRSLQRQVGQRGAEIPTPSNDTPDPTTGLPCKPAALQAMQAAAETGMRLYVVAMVVKGVQSVNTRFGFEVGDRMLRTFKENLERHLSPKDKLFRWDGPAIVALMDRAEPVGQVRTQIRRILDGRLEQNFTVDGRSVLIPIHADFLIFPLMPPMAQVVRQIQKFVGVQSPVKTTA